METKRAVLIVALVIASLSSVFGREITEQGLVLSQQTVASSLHAFHSDQSNAESALAQDQSKSGGARSTRSLTQTQHFTTLALQDHDYPDDGVPFVPTWAAATFGRTSESGLNTGRHLLQNQAARHLSQNDNTTSSNLSDEAAADQTGHLDDTSFANSREVRAGGRDPPVRDHAASRGHYLHVERMSYEGSPQTSTDDMVYPMMRRVLQGVTSVSLAATTTSIATVSACSSSIPTPISLATGAAVASTSSPPMAAWHLNLQVNYGPFFAMLDNMQFFNMLSDALIGVEEDVGDYDAAHHLRSLASGLGWVNMRYESYNHIYTGRRHLADGARQLAVIVTTILLTIALHAICIKLWHRFKPEWTLPSCLLAPVPELVVFSMCITPLAQCATLLGMEGSGLALIPGALIFLYALLLGAVIQGLLANPEEFGLRYLRSDTSTGADNYWHGTWWTASPEDQYEQRKQYMQQGGGLHGFLSRIIHASRISGEAQAIGRQHRLHAQTSQTITSTPHHSITAPKPPPKISTTIPAVPPLPKHVPTKTKGKAGSGQPGVDTLSNVTLDSPTGSASGSPMSVASDVESPMTRQAADFLEKYQLSRKMSQQVLSPVEEVGGNTTETATLGMEIKDRLGLLFLDNKGTEKMHVKYELVYLVEKVILAYILTGLRGDLLQAQRVVCLWTAVVWQSLFAIFTLVLLPYNNHWTMVLRGLSQAAHAVSLIVAATIQQEERPELQVIILVIEVPILVASCCFGWIQALPIILFWQYRTAPVPQDKGLASRPASYVGSVMNQINAKECAQATKSYAAAVNSKSSQQPQGLVQPSEGSMRIGRGPAASTPDCPP